MSKEDDQKQIFFDIHAMSDLAWHVFMTKFHAAFYTINKHLERKEMQKKFIEHLFGEHGGDA